MTAAPRHGWPPRLLRPAAAAYYLGMSEASFRERVAPQIEPLKIGAMVLYRREALDAWVDAQGGGAVASSDPEAIINARIAELVSRKGRATPPRRRHG